MKHYKGKVSKTYAVDQTTCYSFFNTLAGLARMIFSVWVPIIPKATTDTTINPTNRSPIPMGWW
jgi:hypothetical protein